MGEKKVTYNVSYIGGVERSKEAVSEEVIDEVIIVGTKDVIEVKEENEEESIEVEGDSLEKGEERLLDK